METELISVVVPVYNVAPYLPRCLDSILGQSHSCLELLAVNDGSTDGSGEILRAYAEKDARVRVITRENGGVSAARMSGVEAAQGAYVGFVDGDDSVDADMYRRLLENLLRAQADISHCGCRRIDTDGRITDFYGTGKLLTQSKEEGVRGLLSGAFEPGLCNKLYRRDAVCRLLESAAFDREIRINEDLLINYYLFRDAARTVHEDVCLLHYYKRSNSASTCALNVHRVADPLRVKELILQDAQGSEWEQAARAAYLRTNLHMYNNLIYDPDPAFESYREQILHNLQANRQDFDLLGAREKLLARMLLHMPGLYRRICRAHRGLSEKSGKGEKQ